MTEQQPRAWQEVAAEMLRLLREDLEHARAWAAWWSHGCITEKPTVQVAHDGWDGAFLEGRKGNDG